LAVVYNSLNFEFQQECAAKVSPEDLRMERMAIGADDQTPIILSIGRMTRAKRIDLAIYALPALSRARSVKLVVVGDGPEMGNLRRLAKDCSVEDFVHFAGACHDEMRLARLMGLANVFVLPGDAGLSVVHALGYGVPVVTHGDLSTQKPEVEAIIDGKTGAFFRKDDVGDLVEKIQYWIARQSAESDEVRTRCMQQVEWRYNTSAQSRFITDAIDRFIVKAR
jgi:glycosyltransferase involved in cell wall biosynthesis